MFRNWNSFRMVWFSRGEAQFVAKFLASCLLSLCFVPGAVLWRGWNGWCCRVSINECAAVGFQPPGLRCRLRAGNQPPHNIHRHSFEDLSLVTKNSSWCRTSGPLWSIPPTFPNPPRFHTTAREPKRTLSVPGLQNTPKFHEKTPKRMKKECKLW